MKTAKLTLMFLACAAAIPAFAQNTTDSRCGMTNFDRNQNVFTIANPTPGTPNQQCFITVVPKESWTAGMPDLASSQLVEGNYEIAISGGGGGGGGGAAAGGTAERAERDRDHDRDRAERAERDRDRATRGWTEGGVGGGGTGGGGAIPVTTVRYLKPGIYRLTIGSGGQGGAPNGGHGGDGAPTSLSNAYSGETVAGFSGADSWNGIYPQNALADNSADKGLTAIAYSPGGPVRNGERGADGATDKSTGEPGAPGGNGFIKLALKDPPPQAVSTQTEIAPAPAYVAPAETVAPVRPARRDRN
jgi:hypothetical protein